MVYQYIFLRSAQPYYVMLIGGKCISKNKISKRLMHFFCNLAMLLVSKYIIALAKHLIW